MAETSPNMPGAEAQGSPDAPAASRIEQLAGEALESAAAAAAALQARVETGSSGSFELPAFDDGGPGAPQPGTLDLLDDVRLQVRIELGRTCMYVEDVLRLGRDSVVELDKAAGDPVDIFVNDRHIARGEVLVLDDNFCVRVSEIVEGARPPET